jgi:hypothetical protein
MSDESLFREVDEEVRQEQFKKAWAKYGNAITALAVVIVVAVASFKGWQYWQVKQAEAAGETFFTAARLAGEGKHEDARKLFASITHGGYATLAKFRMAADLAGQGKTADAVRLYDELAADPALETPLRDLARVRSGYLLVDTQSPEELLKKLGDLDQATNPWRNPVREIVGLAAYRTKNYEMADKYMNAILADKDVQAGLRQRARMMEDLLTPLLEKTKAQ